MGVFRRQSASVSSMVQRGLTQGVGVNDAWYNTTQIVDGRVIRCPYYNTWSGMLKRCYSEKYLNKFPTYRGCTVCDEWLRFSQFLAWAETQDAEGKHLDKDLLVKGNKVYSPDTCVFVSAAINSLLLDNKAQRGECPQGVTVTKSGKYQAQCKISAKMTYLGTYSNIDAAELAYCTCKVRIISVAAKSAEVSAIPKLRDSLLREEVVILKRIASLRDKMKED